MAYGEPRDVSRGRSRDTVEGTRLSRLMSVLSCGVLLLLVTYTVDAVDVTSAMGVLAYTMDTSCPSGWADLSTDPVYNGRLIKGWNPGDNVGIGAQHLPNNPSTGNDVFSHTHTFSRTFRIPNYATMTKIGIDGRGDQLGVLSAKDYVPDSLSYSGSDNPASSNIQSKLRHGNRRRTEKQLTCLCRNQPALVQVHWADAL
jgi:hypothetical protein